MCPIWGIPEHPEPAPTDTRAKAQECVVYVSRVPIILICTLQSMGKANKIPSQSVESAGRHTVQYGAPFRCSATASQPSEKYKKVIIFLRAETPYPTSEASEHHDLARIPEGRLVPGDITQLEAVGKTTIVLFLPVITAWES